MNIYILHQCEKTKQKEGIYQPVENQPSTSQAAETQVYPVTVGFLTQCRSAVEDSSED